MKTTAHRRVKNEDLPIQNQSDCIHQTLFNELGIGYSNLFSLDAGLNYIDTDYTPKQDFSILSQIEAAEPRMVITLGLKGTSSFTDKHGTELLFNAGYTSIATFSNSTGERHYQAHQAIKQLRIAVSQTWLARYFDETQIKHLFKHDLNLLSHRPISAEGRTIIQQLNNNQIQPELKRVYIQAQTMNLLVTELSGLYQTPNKYTEKDHAIALLARNLLTENYQNPPSVEQLARQAGTNSFKLKQLFKYYFDNTPYGVLLDIRMNKAYELLNVKRYHVNTVADLVGYTHASNFSIAFNKYFGISPKQLNKK